MSASMPQAGEPGGEERFRLLVDRLHEGLAMTDAQGRITYANPRLAQMLGYQETEVADLDLNIVASHPHQPRGPERRKQLRSTWLGVYEAQMLRRDGTALDVLISEGNLKDDAGRLQGGLVLVTDNTEHKRTEELFRQAQKGESLGRMAGGIAHDFNNIFQALRGNLEVAQSPVPEEKRQEILTRSFQLLDRAAALSEKMLEYSGKGFFHSEGVDLGRLIHQNEELLRDMAGSGCALSLAADAPGVEIAGDPHQLLQVVAALVCNAAEAMVSKQGTVRVFVGLQALAREELGKGYWPEPVQAGDYVVLSVLDEGCGFDPNLLDKAFDPFFSTKAPGRGLGLSSTLGIIRAHRGGLQVNSTPHQGTRIRIFFPPRNVLAPTTPEATPAKPPGKRTILLVDDDDDLRQTLQEVLESILGYVVLVARDGLDCVEVYRRCPEAVDLILMDATMPRMDGREAFSRVKELRPAAKAILCSGFSDSLGREQAQENGFLDFLKKPFSVKELKELLDKSLNS